MKVYIGRYPKKDGIERKVRIRIDKWDTWNMDHTLALIIHPMLVQLKEAKHGAPYISDEDVPEELRRVEPDADKFTTDDNWFARWDWVLDEMIWAFERVAKEDEDEYYFSEARKIDMDKMHDFEKRMDSAFRLFGKYFRSLWD